MQKPPDVVPKFWRCEDCAVTSHGKSEKRKTILLDATEARKAATPIKRWRPFLNGFKRQPPSARHCSVRIAGVSTSKGKEKAPISCSSLGDVATPTVPRNIRLTTMSRATRRTPVSPASRAPETHPQGTNRASELSVGKGVLTTQTENIGCSSQHNEIAENCSAVRFLGNATCADVQIEINGHQNTNPQPKLLLTTVGMPPHHPVPNACWTGDFKIFDSTSDVANEIQGIHAHIPSIVSLNVYETVKRLNGQDIELKLLRSLDIWPTPFDLEPPQLGDIGLFFFPSKEQRLKEKFTWFVNMMDKHGLSMKGRLPNAKLMVFTSSQLPSNAHGIVPEVCLWGVLRRVRPKKQCAPGQEKLAVNPPASSNSNSNANKKNHAPGSSLWSGSEGMANVRTNGSDAPGFLELVYRNRTQWEGQAIIYSPVLFNRNATDAPPGFSKPTYCPKRS